MKSILIIGIKKRSELDSPRVRRVGQYYMTGRGRRIRPIVGGNASVHFLEHVCSVGHIPRGTEQVARLANRLLGLFFVGCFVDWCLMHMNKYRIIEMPD